jgi:hypothetical protein
MFKDASDAVEEPLMSRSKRLRAAIVSALAVWCSAAYCQGVAEDKSSGTRAPAITAKERLGEKANDEQRVDNCRVPVDRRGTKNRPEQCDSN